jgi:Flp pilus assembly pilin Flp
MNNLLLILNTKVRDLMYGEEGQDLLEYALLVSLIALGCIASIGQVGAAASALFASISTQMA